MVLFPTVETPALMPLMRSFLQKTIDGSWLMALQRTSTTAFVQMTSIHPIKICIDTAMSCWIGHGEHDWINHSLSQNVAIICNPEGVCQNDSTQYVFSLKLVKGADHPGMEEEAFARQQGYQQHHLNQFHYYLSLFNFSSSLSCLQ